MSRKAKKSILFPAQAGVILNFKRNFRVGVAVPRASGGDPMAKP